MPCHLDTVQIVLVELGRSIHVMQVVHPRPYRYTPENHGGAGIYHLRKGDTREYLRINLGHHARFLYRGR